MDQLDVEWNNNLESMLAVLESVQGGVRGVVVDQQGDPVSKATVVVEGREKNVRKVERY